VYGFLRSTITPFYYIPGICNFAFFYFAVACSNLVGELFKWYICDYANRLVVDTKQHYMRLVVFWSCLVHPEKDAENDDGERQHGDAATSGRSGRPQMTEVMVLLMG